MNKWQTIAQKAKTSQDWLSKSEVAIQLGCNEDQVFRILRHAIDSGEVDTKKMMIVSKSGKMINCDCFRINNPANDKAPSKEAQVSAKFTWPFKEGTRVRRNTGGEGVMLSGGRVRWADGRVTKPQGDTIRKIKPA